MATTTTVLFVHGTGTREVSYRQSLDLVTSQLAALNRDLVAASCYWGHLGAKLLGGGKSVPDFRESGGPEAATPSQIQGALWDHLYTDSLYELRVLALRGAARTTYGAISAGDALREKILDMAGSLERAQTQPPQKGSSLSRVQVLLTEACVDDLFMQTITRLSQHEAFLAAMHSAGDAPGEYRATVARAIVAGLAEAASADKREPHLDFDLALRTSLIKAIHDELGGGERGLFGLAMNTLMGVGGQRAIRKRRGRFSDLMHPFLGDIILYQTRGEGIRTFLKGRITDAGDRVVVIAHSLGGIMCADLLISNQIPNVKCLITVGSQAPLLYELDTLHSLRYSHPQPERFSAPWINIYDPNDFLSYIGGELFGERVIDVPVDNGCTFPDSHSMYWSNPEVWAAVAHHLPR